MIYKSDNGKSYNQEQTIDLLVSFFDNDANFSKEVEGFLISPSQALSDSMSAKTNSVFSGLNDLF